MNSLKEEVTNGESDAAHKRLLSVRGDPFLFADWERVLFLHFAIAPELLRPFVLPPLELDLYEGQAVVSVVAVSMRRFQPTRPLPFAWAFSLLSSQQFLNVRTYVRHRDEPGALFLWGWLSKPLPISPPAFDLPCSFGNLTYHHDYQSGQLSGEVKAGARQFCYRATIAPRSNFEPCASGSLAELAMERYSGFFFRGNQAKIFRAWHPAWLQTSVDATIIDDCLLATKFNWFKETKFVGANFAPGFKHVSLGRVRSLKNVVSQSRKRTHGPSAFFEMP